LEFLEAYARVCDDASVYNSKALNLGENPDEEEDEKEVKSLSVEDRIHLPLHIKIESTIPFLLQRCTNKAFKEKYQHPKKDPKVALFLLGPKKYF
jgi:hypothetical protein